MKEVRNKGNMKGRRKVKEAWRDCTRKVLGKTTLCSGL
jgi:hypothetical protein